VLFREDNLLSHINDPKTVPEIPDLIPFVPITPNSNPPPTPMPPPLPPRSIHHQVPSPATFIVKVPKTFRLRSGDVGT